jgi:hypothetical protein
LPAPIFKGDGMKLFDKMKPKVKRKLMILLGYQVSNLGWFTAWHFYGGDILGFIVGIAIICLADAFIIWKEWD